MGKRWNPTGATGGAAQGAGAGFMVGGPTGGLVGGTLGGLLGGLYTDSGSADRGRQDKLMNQTLDELSQLSEPELQQVIMENPEWLQDLVAAEQGQSEMYNIEMDPRLQNEQYAVLDALQEIEEGGGMNAQDRANLARIQNQSATADRGRRESIQQGMQTRGMGGSGLDLLAQLQSSQAATTQQAQGGLDVAGMAQNRALQAIMQQGQQAGQMRGQQFSEQQKIAQAQDAINKFNTANQFSADQFNVGGKQGLENLRASNVNTGQQLENKRLQQIYDNQFDKVSAKGQVRGQQVDMIGGQRREDLQTQANTISGLGKIATAAGSYYANKKKKDDDVIGE